MQSASAYPLAWPLGRPRTDPSRRARSRFAIRSIAREIADLTGQLRLMKATNVVISTNLKLRKSDSLPLSDQRQPDDCGVAVYFSDRKGRQLCFPCDRWLRVEENLRAVAMTIEALRGIDRWGAGDAMERAFSGFEQLPGPSATSRFADPAAASQWLAAAIDRPEFEKLIFANSDAYRAGYLDAAKLLHPDKGGSSDDFAALSDAKRVLDSHHGLS